jgi:hypothetical protein
MTNAHGKFATNATITNTVTDSHRFPCQQCTHFPQENLDFFGFSFWTTKLQSNSFRFCFLFISISENGTRVFFFFKFFSVNYE